MIHAEKQTVNTNKQWGGARGQGIPRAGPSGLYSVSQSGAWRGASERSHTEQRTLCRQQPQHSLPSLPKHLPRAGPARGAPAAVY